VPDRSGSELRVLQLIDSLAPAGAEQSLVALAPHLRSRGVDVHVCCLTQQDDLRGVLDAAGIPVHGPLVSTGSRRESVRQVGRLLEQLRPDLVHTTLFESDLAGRLAARRSKIPSVSTWANTAYGRTEIRRGGNHWAKVRAAQAADMASARFAARFHAVTPHVAEVMSRRLIISRSKVDVVFRGRDPDVLGRRSDERRSRVRRSLGIGDAAPVALAVARQEPQKGLDVLVRAVPAIRASLPDAVVLVAGREGRSTEQLQVLQAALPEPAAVRFLGARDDVPDLLCAADVFVLPSRWEGAAGSVIEAMAMECPIVASDLETLRGTVDASTATLVTMEDPAALSTGILAAITDPQRARQRSVRARREFENTFTIGSSAARMLAFYHRVVPPAERR
jgi:glycosyltransferase involved in cell wall biosynthesis